MVRKIGSVGGRGWASRRRASHAWRCVEALEPRVLLAGNAFNSSEFTPLAGHGGVFAGPGGLDGEPALDLNGDGLADLLVRFDIQANISTDTTSNVAALLTNPEGPATEVTIAHHASPAETLAAIAADLNNDGSTDVIVYWSDQEFTATRTIETYLGHPDGTFTVGTSISLGASADGPDLSVFDMTGDGKADLFLQQGKKITVYPGSGNGRFGEPVTTNLPFIQTDGIFFRDDLDGDGVKDIVASGPDGTLNPDNTLHVGMGVFKGLATGGYNLTPVFTDAAHGVSVSALRDLTGDGKLDLIAYSAPAFSTGQPTTIFVYRNTGTGFTQSFQSDPMPTGFYGQNNGGSPLKPLPTPDLDGDGDNDMVILEGSGLAGDVIVHVFKNAGNATFTESAAIPVSDFASTGFVTPADVDNDGAVDLTVDQLPSGTGWQKAVFFNDGSDNFDAPAVTVAPDTVAVDPGAVADLNGDGKLDVVFAVFNAIIESRLNTTGRAFGSANTSPSLSTLTTVSDPRDFTGDGLPDLLSFGSNGPSENAAEFQLLAGDGAGRFDPQPLVVNDPGSANDLLPVVGDINGDGLPDLVFKGNRGVYVSINDKPLAEDTAGATPETARDLGTASGHTSLLERITPQAQGDLRDDLDEYHFTLAQAAHVRVTAAPEANSVIMTIFNANGIGAHGNDFPTGLDPAVVEFDAEAGTYLIQVEKGAGGETNYRLDIDFPGEAPAIGVSNGLSALTSGQPAPIDFGSVIVTTTDTTNNTTFRVTNTGGATLNLGAVTLPAGFALGDDAPPTSLEPGASDTFSVRLITDAPGTFAGNITIPSTDAGVDAFVIPVTGEVTGVPAVPTITVLQGATPVVSGQATPVSFGTVGQGKTPPQRVFTIRNDGDANLTLGALQLPASGYAVVDDLTKTNLAPGETATFTIKLNSSVLGTFTGNITIDNNSGGGSNTFSIPVTGVVNQGGGGGGGGTPDLSATLKGTLPATVKSGRKTQVKLKLVNDGDGKAKGKTDVTFYLSTDQTFDAGDTLALQKTGVKLKLKPNKAKIVKGKFKLPAGLAPGAYFLIVVAEPEDTLGDPDASNNTVVSPTAITYL